MPCGSWMFGYRPPMRLAIVDFDGTAIRGNSWHEYFRAELRRRPSRAPLLLAGWMIRRCRIWQGVRLREFALAGQRGAPRTELEAWGRHLYATRLRAGVRRELVREVERRRRDGFVIVVATAAWDFMVMPFAAEIQTDAMVATRVAYAGDRCTGGIVGRECMGLGKQEALLARFSMDSVDWDRSVFWTDHVSDIPLLKQVGERWFVTRLPNVPDGLPEGTRRFPAS